MSDAQWMKIHGTPFAVRMDLLSEGQAKANHDQTLDRLNERGGVDLTEAVAMVQRRKWHRQDVTEAVTAIVAAYDDRCAAVSTPAPVRLVEAAKRVIDLYDEDQMDSLGFAARRMTAMTALRAALAEVDRG